ncbi:hypothetical protein E4T81_01910 [Barnesiella sp. WM24]|uniref:hypothetical protein n=1 Tax=Barnesiella sp. WM24 TaxID=2558278 RepID=UPI0010720C00|nr:hypothetical protein [Barnesiella sp. WM24]TFU94637.1 hypothetical protein E4T81_01910 [Barnesiella sp. WM24]
MNLPICSPALEKGHGVLSELHMTAEEIRSLELQGFIKNAISGDECTWALTQHGKDVRNYFLSKRSLLTRIYDWVMHDVLRMDLTI